VRVLDTDVCVELLRGNTLIIEQRDALNDDLSVTWMTAAELYYGAERSSAPGHNRRLVARFLETVPLIRCREASAREFGVLKAVLEKLGQRLADADLIIAAACLALDAVLVTGNVAHFSRVPGLHVEGWIRGRGGS